MAVKDWGVRREEGGCGSKRATKESLWGWDCSVF